MSIFALNITPYITSSIIIQLLTISFPKLEEMQRDGEEGRKKLTAITIRSEKLTDPTVGTNAFAGVPETAKVTIPKAKYSAYKKWLKKKGLTKKNKFAKLK